MAFKRKTRKGKAAAKPEGGKKKLYLLRRIAAVILAVAIIGTVGYFFLRRDNGQMSIAENGVGSFLSPVQNFFANIGKSIQRTVNNWRDYSALEEQYDDLLRENEQLSLQLSAADEVMEENARLTSLLNAQSEYETLDPIYARVIAHDASQWFFSFSINRGTSSGVGIGMAVVNGDGLVGRVYDVGLNYAKVLTIIDSRSGLSCLVQRTRDNGILRGGVEETSAFAECYVNYLPNVNNILPGDIVVTSGTDQLYPKGLKIGSITQVSLSGGADGNYAIVEPSVDFRHLEEVLVLREVVETDDTGKSSLPSTITPTPAPTSTPSPTPMDAYATPEPENPDEYFNYPNSNRNNGSTIEKLPEDEWLDI
ncbi:MAG: rod shape-determining protein MreC [Clostridia bacterium]|nr:rod shape-determining protein MreC [Clostridia bacterium]